jgi:hypothetical protein
VAVDLVQLGTMDQSAAGISARQSTPGGVFVRIPVQGRSLKSRKRKDMKNGDGNC